MGQTRGLDGGADVTGTQTKFLEEAPLMVKVSLPLR